MKIYLQKRSGPSYNEILNGTTVAKGETVISMSATSSRGTFFIYNLILPISIVCKFVIKSEIVSGYTGSSSNREYIIGLNTNNPDYAVPLAKASFHQNYDADYFGNLINSVAEYGATHYTIGEQMEYNGGGTANGSFRITEAYYVIA